MNRDLNIILERQGNEEKKYNLMKEGEKGHEKNRLNKEVAEKEIKRQEREAKDKEQNKGNDFGLGM
jgi:hypothetical protein